MEILKQILILLLLASATTALAYLVIVFARLKVLLENLNKTTEEINSKLPSILENIEKASEQLADVTSRAQSQFEVFQNLSDSIQSYLQRFRDAFSLEGPSNLEGFPSTLRKIFALIKAIRTVITKLKT
jgi:ABC-type transporter Mla subunit MlaD